MFRLLTNRQLVPAISYMVFPEFWKDYIGYGYIDTTGLPFRQYVRGNFSYLPEYAYEPHLNNIESKDFSALIEEISLEYLKCDSSKVYVREGKLEEWQGVISMLTPIPFIGYMLLHQGGGRVNSKTYTILPTINMPDTLNTDIVKQNDLHIHLNGASEVFYSWQKALVNPKNFIDSYRGSGSHVDSLELLLYQEQMTKKDFFDILVLSKKVRELLVQFLISGETVVKLSSFEQSIVEAPLSYYDYNRHPYEKIDEEACESVYCYELKMWIGLFNTNNPVIEKLMHFYILVQSQFMRILVQQVKQNGFRQFLYISDNNLRDIYEDDGYIDRIRQLNENAGNSDRILEFRVTPKNFCRKLEQLKAAYNTVTDTSSMNLVCHFIKYKELSRNQDSAVSYERYAYNKSKTLEHTKSLLGCIIPALNGALGKQELIDSFVGIDVAGDELNARPEAFAFSCSMIRKKLGACGKNIGITFHAGEDFVHMISGIRYIYEVYTFLDYQSGDRIGHANALGLDPIYWREQLNGIVQIKQGEWLDNLIFFAVLTNTTDEKVLEKIRELWGKIYKEYEDLSLVEILDYGFSAYHLRHLSIDERKDLYASTDSDSATIVNSILETYLYGYEYDEYITIELEEKFDAYIRSLQNKILSEMAQKGFIIESMISSNVRISYYNRYKQHHILKWLEKKHDMPLVTLASDDPGIFNNNILIEYAHLYDMVDDKDIFKEYVEALLNNGNIASF